MRQLNNAIHWRRRDSFAGGFKELNTLRCAIVVYFLTVFACAINWQRTIKFMARRCRDRRAPRVWLRQKTTIFR